MSESIQFSESVQEKMNNITEKIEAFSQCAFQAVENHTHLDMNIIQTLTALHNREKPFSRLSNKEYDKQLANVKKNNSWTFKRNY